MHSQRNELLAALPASELAALTPHLKRVLLSHGVILHKTGETIENVYFPEGGAVSLVVDLANGDRIETALVGRDGAIGGFSAIHGQPALNTAVVQIECTALTVSAEQVYRHCADGSVLSTLLSLHNQFLLAQAQQSAACNVSHSLDARLSRWLLRACDLCGPHFALTQEALAAFLGVRRTSVSLTAHGLQAAGIIHYRRGTIEILDLDRLGEISCECHAALHKQHDRLLIEAIAPRAAYEAPSRSAMASS